MENENLEPGTDLGLALGCSGYTIARRTSNDLGAGANAASSIIVNFVAADPLSEIVWSPHRGLCLKCTECSFLDNEHSLLRAAGASNMVNQQTNTSSSTFLDLNAKVLDMDYLDKSAGDNDGIRLCHEPQIDNDDSLQEVARIESLFDDPANEVGDVGHQTWLARMEMVLASEVQTNNECGASGPPENKLTSAEAEKDYEHHEGIQSCRRKGKEKTLSDGDVKGMMSKAEVDDSDESVESCNSAALFSTGKRRKGFEQELIVGSKRVKQDSPFMNWISNMMKGFLKAKDETPSLMLTAANTNKAHGSAIENLDASNTKRDPGCGSSVSNLFFTPRVGPSKRSNEENIAQNTSSNNLPVDVMKKKQALVLL
ncbi:uncharacterized protein LOC120213653 [Hibiscus syriacus]|uniref:uncharacterized protein LOC120213653 n=1 Tax=Hibiscus syriacus TaxID=106335 RepID=UPI001921A157|nr:uncharacterized protein LOC120213653 [Hibiscus syriacus]